MHIKRMLHIFISISFLFVLGGCNKLEYVESKTVSAKIVNTEYKQGYSTTLWSTIGEMTVPITTDYPDEYNVVIEYEGIKYYFDNPQYYKICKNNNGKKVNCTLNIKYYADGTYRYQLQNLINLDN